MSGSLIRILLRALSIAIAMSALVDPVFSRSTSRDRPVVAVHLTAGPSAAIDSALRELLIGRELITRVPAGPRLPCAIDEDCVVVADGSIDSDWDLARAVSLITAGMNPEPMNPEPVKPEANVRVQSVMLSGGHRAVAGAARVVLAGRGVAGKRTEVRISDGGAVVGSATLQWSAATTATIEMPWWPLDAGVRALRIEAIPFDGESTAIDNVIDRAATITTTRFPILVFDPRPSWNSTFVRRALEDDARFAVDYRSRIAPTLSAGTPRGRIDANVLENAAAVIVGAPDALTAEEAGWLERYVRVRGGTLVLLPERTAAGASAPLFPDNGTEHLSADAEKVGALHATEILRWSDLPVTATVIAMSGPSPSIVSMPRGNGRIIVSGAMDAWRYRDRDSGAFDRFWTSVVAQGAALGEGLQLIFEEGIAPRGSRARFVVRDRRLEPLAIVEASAVVRCQDETRVARLWPAGALGEFVGEVSAARQGECTVEAMVGDRRASGSVAIVDRPARGTELTLAKLERQARASGGVVATEGELQNVARALAAGTPAPSRVVSVHPMRDPWWILPFAGCLSAEWWLRRRIGLR